MSEQVPVCSDRCPLGEEAVVRYPSHLFGDEGLGVGFSKERIILLSDARTDANLKTTDTYTVTEHPLSAVPRIVRECLGTAQ